jgi:hypothetical protein
MHAETETETESFIGLKKETLRQGGQMSLWKNIAQNLAKPIFCKN